LGENRTKRTRETALRQLQETIEERLSEREPEVEVLALEQPANEALRLYIDHPQGVDLALCEQVTNHLRDLLVDYSLEVSSPGPERPLAKPEHFRRFLGRRVRVRTRDEFEGRNTFTGTLTDADDGSVSVDAEGRAVRIPLDRVRRSNLVPEGGA
jgi:ribosome maturation factor RimP